MILSGKEIARHIGEEIVIMPFNPKRLNPNSYNLTLADELMVYDNYELDMKRKYRTSFKDPAGGLCAGTK